MALYPFSHCLSHINTNYQPVHSTICFNFDKLFRLMSVSLTFSNTVNPIVSYIKNIKTIFSTYTIAIICRPWLYMNLHLKCHRRILHVSVSFTSDHSIIHPILMTSSALTELNRSKLNNIKWCFYKSVNICISIETSNCQRHEKTCLLHIIMQNQRRRSAVR